WSPRLWPCSGAARATSHATGPATGQAITARMRGLTTEFARRPIGACVRSRAMHGFPAANDFDGWVAQLGNSERRQRAKIYLREAGPPALPAVRRGMHHPK